MVFYEFLKLYNICPNLKIKHIISKSFIMFNFFVNIFYINDYSVKLWENLNINFIIWKIFQILGIWCELDKDHLENILITKWFSENIFIYTFPEIINFFIYFSIIFNFIIYCIIFNFNIFFMKITIKSLYK
jgi:hypothetical protein